LVSAVEAYQHIRHLAIDKRSPRLNLLLRRYVDLHDQR